MKQSILFARFFVIIVATMLMNSCSKQEAETSTQVANNKVASNRMQSQPAKTENTDLRNQQTQESGAEKKECIFKNDAPSSDENLNSLMSVRSNYFNNYIPIMFEMLKSDDIETVKKALVYLFWLPPFGEYESFSPKYSELSITEDYNKLLFPQLINQYDVDELNSDNAKFVRILKLMQIEPSVLGSYVNDAINELFDHVVSTTKITNIKDNAYLLESLRIFSKYLSKQNIIEIHKHYELLSEEVTNYIDSLIKSKTTTKENECNGYFYDLPGDFEFLTNGKYLDDKIEKLISNYACTIINNLKAPHEVKYDKQNFRFYRYGYSFLMGKTFMFLDNRRLDWANRIDSWITESLDDFNTIIKDGSGNNRGEIKYFDYDLGKNVSKSIEYLFKLWITVAPIKACGYLLECFKDDTLRAYYKKYIFDNDIYYEYFLDVPFYLQHQQLFIETFLRIMETVKQKDENQRSYVQKEIYGLVNNVLGAISYNYKIEPEPFSKLHFKDYVYEYSIDDWRKFFAKEK